MENYYNYNNPGQKQRRISPLVLGLIVVQIIFMVIILSLIFMSPGDDKIPEDDIEAQPHVSISNFELASDAVDSDSSSDSDADSSSDDSQLPDDSQEAMEFSVTEIMKNNLANIDTDTSVEFRADSIKTKTFKRQNLNYFTAIVDLPEQKQSYRIFYEYSDDEQNPYLSENDQTIALCLDDSEEKKYPNFACKDIYGPKTRNAIVANYINYFDFDYFSVSMDLDHDPDTIVIGPSVTYQNSEDTKKAYIKEVKDAIKQLGISPDIFKYYVLTEADVNYIN